MRKIGNFSPFTEIFDFCPYKTRSFKSEKNRKFFTTYKTGSFESKHRKCSK